MAPGLRWGPFSPLWRMTMEEKAIIALRGDCFCAPLFPDWLNKDSRAAVRYEEQANLPNADVGFRLVFPNDSFCFARWRLV